jgi:hypothetical protein
MKIDIGNNGASMASDNSGLAEDADLNGERERESGE